MLAKLLREDELMKTFEEILERNNVKVPKAPKSYHCIAWIIYIIHVWLFRIKWKDTHEQFCYLVERYFSYERLWNEYNDALKNDWNTTMPFKVEADNIVFKTQAELKEKIKEKVLNVSTAKMSLPGVYENIRQKEKEDWILKLKREGRKKGALLVVIREENFMPSKEKRLEFEKNVRKGVPCYIIFSETKRWIAFSPRRGVGNTKDWGVVKENSKVEFR